VTMSRLVGDYAALPDFLRSLGFDVVTFSYPLRELASSYLSHADCDLVTYTPDELHAAFQAVKDLKRSFPVLNPTASLDDMQRHLRANPSSLVALPGGSSSILIGILISGVATIGRALFAILPSSISRSACGTAVRLV
jgi:hypothetical protein